MGNSLRLTLHPDPDGSVELLVEASANGFAGRASAWFAREQIAEFAIALEAFPIRAEAPPTLEGGFWKRDGSGLEQCHVSLRVLPLDGRGTLGVQVQLARPEWADARPEFGHRVALEMLTEYAALQRFAGRVAALATGKAEEATLESRIETG